MVPVQSTRVASESQLKVEDRQAWGSPGGLCAPSPDVADLRPVQQLPAVGGLVAPARVPGVGPQQPDLVRGVASMPQGIPEVLTWA